MEELEKMLLISAYLNNDLDTYSKLVKQYHEYEHIDLFINIANHAFEHFKNSKYCSFILDDSFFSLIDCTFKGYDELYITSKDNNYTYYNVKSITFTYAGGAVINYQFYENNTLQKGIIKTPNGGVITLSVDLQFRSKTDLSVA